MNFDVNDDVVSAKEMIIKGLKPVFGNKAVVFPFSNENIKGYFQKLNLNNKKILTVASSGDHALSAILYGAKEVECFDINIFTKYYIYLKKAAIITLDHDEFCKIVAENNFTIFDLRTYKKVRDSLDNYSRIFWDELYNEFYPQDINNLFYQYGIYQKLIYRNVPYLQKNSYYRLQEKLFFHNFKFTKTCITQLHRLITNNKYDLMFLSNISDWLAKERSVEQLELLKEIILKLSCNLTENGSILFAYLFNYKTFEEIVPKDKIEGIFNKDECSEISVAGEFAETDDVVLMYQKNYIRN